MRHCETNVCFYFWLLAHDLSVSVSCALLLCGHFVTALHGNGNKELANLDAALKSFVSPNLTLTLSFRGSQLHYARCDCACSPCIPCDVPDKV